MKRAFARTTLVPLVLVSAPARAEGPVKETFPAVSSVGNDVEVARSRPQWSAGLLLAAGLSDLNDRDLHTNLHAGFAMGLRADGIFFRRTERSLGFGPYVDILTERFSTFEAGGGLSWLLPVLPSIPVVLSGGAFARASDRGWEPGVSANLFFGARGYNFHSNYGMANGLFVDTRMGVGGPQLDVVMGIRLDLEILALPVLYAVGSMKGRK